MKQLASIGLLIIAAAACAPAQGTIAPAPRPEVVGTGPAQPTQALAESGAPLNWWLLDPTVNRVRGIGAVRGYEELLRGQQPRRQVVVAILDSGVDIQHEDLDGVLWVNEDEIPGNRIDDDRNGYVDDIHGWNFIGGRDGQNVSRDTWEMARLYGQYRPRYEGARRDTLSVAAQREYDEYQRVKRDVEEGRQESQQLLMQAQTIERVYATLRTALGTQELTTAAVRALTPTSQEATQAKDIYLQLAANGVTPRQVQDAREYAENRLNFGLNPDFNPRPIVGDNYADYNERGYGNPDVEGPDPDHGTHVAGIVAAERGNGLGIDGIASSARIMSVRTVPDGDERDKDVANAIRYAVDNGAHIINMSFGKSYSPGKSVVDEAVRYATQRGVLMVHGSGNDGSDLATASNFPNRFYASGDTSNTWIEVGASSWHGGDTLVAEFSNYGRQQVDVFAPGVDIYSTVPNNGYEENSGTSMASPVVAGLAALLMGYFPELTAAQVRRIILDTSTKYTDDQVIGPGDRGRVRFGELSVTGGVVNAYAAIRAAQQMTGR